MHSEKLIPIYEPSGDAGGDIIFLHGLDGDWKKTWRDADLPEDDAYGWPHWLGEELERIGMPSRVYSFDYPACSTKWIGATLPIFDRAGDLLEEIDLTLPPSSQLFFICHSLGGLMVKKMLSLARDKGGTKAQVPDRTRAILFLGTPHQGSGVANIVCTLIPKLLSRKSVTLEELARDNPGLREMRDAFLNQASVQRWAIHQVAEGKDTFGLRIVDENSAFCGTGDCVVADEDHISLPKPKTRDSSVFRRAVRMAQDFFAHPLEIEDRGVSNRSGESIRRLILQVLAEQKLISLP